MAPAEYELATAEYDSWPAEKDLTPVEYDFGLAEYELAPAEYDFSLGEQRDFNGLRDVAHNKAASGSPGAALCGRRVAVRCP